MKITVIIVSYNVKYYLEQCLISLKKALHGIDSEVFVVDDHSRDGSMAYLRKRFNSYNFVVSNHNLGFARANNLAIKRSKGEYILLLNPDTIVGENTIRECLSFMDSHPLAGGLGVKMLKCDGEKAMESRRGLPSPLTAFYKMCGLCSKYPNSRRFGKYYMSYLSWDKPEKIEVISGAYCLLRHAAIDKIGMLDEDFFMYGEDIDLSYRLLKGGYENWYLPSMILHYKGESTQKSSFRYVHVFYEAMLIFFRKHYRHLNFWITLPIKTAIYVKAFFALSKMLVKRSERMVGFISPQREREVEYVFVCSERNVNSCRRLADDKGLSSHFIVADGEHKSLTHVERANLANSSAVVYVVYDISIFRYEEILAMFADNPIDNVRIGTFNPKNRTIITDVEVIR